MGSCAPACLPVERPLPHPPRSSRRGPREQGGLQPSPLERPQVPISNAERRTMITGDLRSQIDRIWDAFWSGGIANPLEVMEQLTYLLFIRRLDDLQTAQELKARRLGSPVEGVFPKGQTERGTPYADLRWSHFKHFEPRRM